MHYFSYGSNLNPEQMRQRCPDHKVVGMAALHDHRLAFPLTSHDWGGGVASVVPSHGTSVWGIVYELSEGDLVELDRYEGYRGPDDQHNLYDRQTVFVELTRPEDGSIPRRVRAWCYFARPSNPAAPSRRYLDAVLAGARHHHLPDEYVAALAKTVAGD
jgi:gamma-glutamylcyclotransferase (GGCT)/AIG2-like uncharacterized protein YtfP